MGKFPVQWLLVLLALPLASSVGLAETVAAATSTEIRIDYDRDAQQVLTLVESSRQLRAQLPQFVNEATQAMDQHKGALPAAYSLRLAKALRQADELRGQLFQQALRHRGALYRVDEELTDEVRLAEIVIAMSAAVTLYENNRVMRTAFADAPVLRRKLNEGYPEFGIAPNFYDSSSIRAAHPEYRKAMADAVRYFSDRRETMPQHLEVATESIRALYGHIAQSPVLQEFQGGNVFREIVVLPGKAIGAVAGLSLQELGRLKFTSSKILGNTLGLVRWRSGKLRHDVSVLQAMRAQLQPGDILLEKTPFTLTDKTIPGHFGHVAIYVGTLDQLRELDALESPMVQKHLEQIAAGRGVVEALRNGVQLNALEDFMNVDDVAILRPRNLSQEQRREAVELALGNLGKKYDFNFDVNTTETIVCSELAYLVYPQVDFVTKRVLSSFTISPDDIAQVAGKSEDDALELVLFAHDGRLLLAGDRDDGGGTLYNQLVKGAPVADALVPNLHFTGFVAND